MSDTKQRARGDWLSLKDGLCAVAGAAGDTDAEAVRQHHTAGPRIALLNLDLDRLVQTATGLKNERQRLMTLPCDAIDLCSIEAAAEGVQSA